MQIFQKEEKKTTEVRIIPLQLEKIKIKTIDKKEGLMKNYLIFKCKHIVNNM